MLYLRICKNNENNEYKDLSLLKINNIIIRMSYYINNLSETLIQS